MKYFGIAILLVIGLILFSWMLWGLGVAMGMRVLDTFGQGSTPWSLTYNIAYSC